MNEAYGVYRFLCLMEHERLVAIMNHYIRKGIYLIWLAHEGHEINAPQPPLGQFVGQKHQTTLEKNIG